MITAREKRNDYRGDRFKRASTKALSFNVSMVACVMQFITGVSEAEQCTYISPLKIKA